MIRKALSLPETDVRSLPMGAQGADIWLSQEALEKFPFAIECKNTEKLNIWAAFSQAQRHSGVGKGYRQNSPMVIFSRNRSPILVTLELDILLGLLSERKA